MTKPYVAITTVLVGVILGGCRSNNLIADYEVLALPRAPEDFKPGSIWKPGIGPIAPPPSGTNTITASGAASVLGAIGKDTGGRIQASLDRWVSGSLGFSDSEVTTLALNELWHEKVRDGYAVGEAAAVLWEVIGVKEFTFTVAEERAVGIDVKAVENELSRALGGDAAISVEADSTRFYTARSDRPLVAAIRVVRIDYRVASGMHPLDLSDSAVSSAQELPFGYLLILQDPVDITDRSASFRIDNPTSRRFEGTRHLFEGDDPWISPNRTAIAESDERLDGADFVWDRISLVWNKVLSKSQAMVTRQYITLKSIHSGLKGTH